MDILSIIDTTKLTNDMSFSFAVYCSKLLSTGSTADEAQVRTIVIHILNVWDTVPPETRQLWADIAESIGFYPYLEKNKESMKLNSFSDEIRQKSFQSDYLPSTYMHREQKRLSDYIFAGRNVIASAPTSFGKSLLIEEIVASQKYKNIVVIQPTLALLDETRIKLKKYENHYKIIVRTSQDASNEKGNLFLLTAERVMEYDSLPQIDLLIIDEFYKLSLRRVDERADVLNNAFLKIVGRFNSKFYFLGPNIDGITDGFAEKYNAVFYKSDFSLVDCNVINMATEIDYTQSKNGIEKEKCVILYNLLYSLRNEQTLVYCSTPARARRFAKEYLEYLKQKKVAMLYKNLPLTEWIDVNVSKKWSLSEELRYGISVHDGSLQKHIGTSIIDYFNKGLLNCVFCTSTIIEGVNTSAKNVIVFDEKKGNKDLDFFDYSNIKGRSGRLMEHYVGKVYNFAPPPPKESIVIDIPFFEQSPISDEILVNLPRNEVHAEHLPHYNELNDLPSSLLEIIKKNGVSVCGQLNIYHLLEQGISTSQYAEFAWTRMPTWNQLNYILTLAENNIFEIDKHGINSVKQLSFYLDAYRKKHNIMSVVSLIFENKKKSVSSRTAKKNETKYFDEAIEQAFHIYRHWFQFTVPKAFRVVDSLQRYVCDRHKKKAGSYSFFVQQLENDFIPENLSILSEFGIPTSAIRKIASQIPQYLSEDAMVEYIKKHKGALTRSLLQYEKDKLDYCL